MSEKEKAAAEAPVAKKGKKKLLMIVAAGLMVAAGVGGYFMLAGGGGAEGEAAKEPEPEPGEVVVMDAVTVNLKDGHYLKIKLALQATADAAHEPEGSKALDLAIDQFSEYEMGELSTTEGRHKAKEVLREHVKEAYHGDVMDVYFTEFVMQ
jgi:flagellar FliL protein